MNSGPSASGQPVGSEQTNTSGKHHKRTVDIGVATIVAACITAILGIVGLVYVARVTAPTSAAPKTSHGTVHISITSPATATISYQSTLSGTINNLQPGQLVWTFFQFVNRNGTLGSQIYPTSGPCRVDFTSHIWTCPGAYIGAINDSHSYRVCAAILNFSEANATVNLIENTYAKDANLPYWFTSVAFKAMRISEACMSVSRIN